MHASSRTRRHFLKESFAAVAAFALRGRAFAEDTRTLRSIADERGLLTGCAVAPEYLAHEPLYAATVAEQANLLVPENALKWRALRPAADAWNFGPADAIFAFADAHGQKLRGHTLCWHQALPGWLASTATKQNARQLLTDHIHTVAGRYAGKLHAWDVVNEVMEPKEGREDGLRKSPWLEWMGPEYIDIAFWAARAADAAALLTYNEYGIELDTPEQTTKRAQVLELLRDLQKRGVPVDAFGVQSHLKADGPMPGAGLLRFVRELHAMGLQVFITEMDISDYGVPGSIAERDAVVAKLYGDYVGMMLAEPNVKAVLTWGVTDQHTFVNRYPRPDGQPQRPLLFDAECKPKPSFFAMRKAFHVRRNQLG